MAAQLPIYRHARTHTYTHTNTCVWSSMASASTRTHTGTNACRRRGAENDERKIAAILNRQICTERVGTCGVKINREIAEKRKRTCWGAMSPERTILANGYNWQSWITREVQMNHIAKKIEHAQLEFRVG